MATLRRSSARRLAPLLSLLLPSLAVGTCTSPAPSCFIPSVPTQQSTARKGQMPALYSSASTPPFSTLSEAASPFPPSHLSPPDNSLSPFLQELLAAGTLRIVRRPGDYKETRERATGGRYEEPLELYLLGTAHTSLTSAQHVEQLIHEVRPDAVVVELCKSRSALVALNGSHLLEEDLGALLGLSTNSKAKAGDDPQRSLRLAGGRGPLLLQWLLAFCVRALATKLKVTFGQEFKAARQAATQVGATLVLGDRPIELTMKRAWACMGPNERGALLVAALGLLLNIRELAASESKGKEGREADRAAVLQDEARRSEVLRMLKGQEGGSGVLGGGDKTRQALQQFFPGIYGALIGERDAYLAWACKRSKAVSNAKRVVAVMGLLHLDGVEEQIKSDRAGDKLRFSTVARLPDPPAPSSPVSLTSEHAVLIQHTAMLWLRNRGPAMVTSLATGAALGQVLGLLGPRVWEGMEQAGLANLPPLPFPF